jgi:pimeloyl-ACP methyl ester carboxylesterase
VSTAAPDTIVLIHGFWVTPRSWEHWKDRYEAAGYQVLTPAYPGFEVEVEALRENPQPIEDLTVPAIVEHLESVIGALDAPPILMGHSAGGAFMQIVMDHGFGAAGVAINSAPTEGVPVAPFSQIKSTWPVIGNPKNHHRAVGFDFDQWNYAFTNEMPEARARELYDRYHVPASGQILWDSVTANLLPGHQDTWVDYKNDRRAPLLFISGDHDHLMPPKVQASNAKHYKSDATTTEVKVFDGPHLLPANDNWTEVADFALDWAVAHAAEKTPA